MIDEWKMKASKLKSLTQWLNLENCHPRVLKAKKMMEKKLQVLNKLKAARDLLSSIVALSPVNIKI